MNCRRAEELFSDHADGTLTPPLDRELSAHFETCEACSSLYASFLEVVGALDAWSTPDLPEALSHRLSQYVVGATEAGPIRPSAPARPTTPRVLGRPRWVASSSWLAAAAVIALVLLWRPPEVISELTRKTSRMARQTYSFGVRTYLQTEQWIDELNVLRITVGVAFEDRLDRINEQLRDLELSGRESPERDDDGEQSRDYEPARVSPTRQRACIAAPEHFSRSPL